MNAATTSAASTGGRNHAYAPMPQIKTNAFEGPMDLLLHLIRVNKVDIYDIPIAEITRQYLDAVALLETIGLGVMSEYVVLAATLIEIKSRLLLPVEPASGEDDESVDPRSELVSRLLEYERFQSAVETMRAWEDERRLLFFRGALENVDDYLLPVPENQADANLLSRALRRLLLEGGEEERPVTAVTPRRRLSLRLKMLEVVRRVSREDSGLPFDALFELPCPRYEIVLTFLALLELVRQGRLQVDQEQEFESIRLSIPLES